MGVGGGSAPPGHAIPRFPSLIIPPDLGLTLDEAEGHFHCLAYHRLSQLLRLTGSFVGFQWMSLTAWAAETIIQPFLLKNMSRFRPITRNGDVLSSAEPP